MVTHDDPSKTYGTDLCLSGRMDGPLGSSETQGAVLLSGPVDLPIPQPTKFELVINLKTDKAFGLTIPRQSSSGRMR